MLVINQHMKMIPHLIYPPGGGNINLIEDEEYSKKRLYIFYFSELFYFSSLIFQKF